VGSDAGGFAVGASDDHRAGRGGPAERATVAAFAADHDGAVGGNAGRDGVGVGRIDVRQTGDGARVVGRGAGGPAIGLDSATVDLVFVEVVVGADDDGAVVRHGERFAVAGAVAIPVGVD